MLVNKKPTLPANAALDPYLRSVLSSGKLVAAAANEKELGTLDGRALAADDLVAVLPRNEAGVRKVVASKSISQYADVFTDDGGKVTDTSAVGNYYRGIALESASGDGSIIPVLYLPSDVAEV